MRFGRFEIWSGAIFSFFLFSWIRGPFSDDDVAKSGKRRKEFGWGCLIKMKCYSRVLARSTRNALLRGVLLRALLGALPQGAPFVLAFGALLPSVNNTLAVATTSVALTLP